jgi:hypothetical protein
MAGIIVKSNPASGSTPDPQYLAVGELAFNSYDGVLFSKKHNGELVLINPNGNSLVSASYALTASYALNGGGGGGGNIDYSAFATTGSNIFSGSQTVNGKITVSDLLNLPTNSELVGPKVSFQKANYSSSQQDVLTSGSMILARGNNQGLYNAALEASYDNVYYTSPSGTLWNSIHTDPINYGWYNLQTVSSRMYDTWENAANDWPAVFLVDLPMVMHDTINDKYYLFKFTQWTSGSQGGGFAYDRYEITLPTKILFNRPNYSASFEDVISDEVVLRRDNTGSGIFNSVREEYIRVQTASPVGTEWNSIHTDSVNNGWNDLSNVRSRTYLGWSDAVNNNPSASIGLELVMHDIRVDKYWMIKFTNWESGSVGGGFSYERTEIKLDPGIKFPDGKIQTKAFIPENSLIQFDDGQSSLYTYPYSLTNTSHLNVTALGNGVGIYSELYNTILVGSSVGNFSSLYGTTAIGYSTATESSASLSIFIGGSGNQSKHVTSSIFIGNGAGAQISDFTETVAIGNSAGYRGTTSSYNNFIGYEAGEESDNLSYSNFIGMNAGSYNQNIIGSNALGYSALSAISDTPTTIAEFVNSIGWESGVISRAHNSIFIGTRAGKWAGYLTDGSAPISHSVFIGQDAGNRVKSSSYSTFIGFRAGAEGYEIRPTPFGGVTFVYSGNPLGSNNIIIGTNITLPSGRENSINIGGILFGTGSYANTSTGPFVGTPGNGRIGINVVTPQHALHVSGSSFVTENAIFGSRSTNRHQFTGSVNLAHGITGSLLGTASFALNSLSTATFPFTGSAIITGSLFITGGLLTVQRPTSPTIFVQGNGGTGSLGVGAEVRVGAESNTNFGLLQNGAVAWYIDTNKHFIPNVNNSYDIGTSSTRVRNLYVTSITSSNAIGSASFATTSSFATTASFARNASATLSYVSSSRVSDLSIALNDTYSEVVSASLSAGVWHVIATVTTTSATSRINTTFLRLSDGTNHFASTQQTESDVSNNSTSMTVNAIINLNSTTTVGAYIAGSAAATSAVVVKAAQTSNGSGNNATMITAVKIA